MIHSYMTTFETLRARVLPVPKQMDELAGSGLLLNHNSKIHLTAPTAEVGPIKTASARAEEFFTSHCAGLDADGIPVTLSLADAPETVTACRNEAYELTITDKGIDIVGYGPNGLLYGVITLQQLCVWENGGACLPALHILDWPTNPTRGILEECRYGSNLMEEDDWYAMIEEMAQRKMNYMILCLYGCWSAQFGHVTEFLYFPVKDHPEVQTPMYVRYWSPAENRWVDRVVLPTLFDRDLLHKVFARCRDMGISICPMWNSLGHNTLLPRMIPETSAKGEDGTPSGSGFCTSNPATYDLLYSIYDQLIDEFVLPYGMDSFCIGMDEIQTGAGRHPDDLSRVVDPWCHCPACRDKDRGDLMVDHVVRQAIHLKEKGIKNVVTYYDMLLLEKSVIGDQGEKLAAAAKKAGVQDTLLMAWWNYFDLEEKMDFDSLRPELGLRTLNMPWSGYYIWGALTNPMRCSRIHSKLNQRDGSEGLCAYAMWDPSYDRIHDAVGEYGWSAADAGTEEDITDRYVLRHFAARADEARRAYSLIDWITEERKTATDDPVQRVISHSGLLRGTLTFYNYSYMKSSELRNYAGDALNYILKMRRDTTRILFSASSMAREAAATFRDLALDSRCDRAMADRMAYECENYRCIAEDWLTMLHMYDLTQAGQFQPIASLARSRQQARLDLMALCQRTKDAFAAESMAMREHSILMQMFADIADHMEASPDATIDLMNLGPVLSERSVRLRLD